VHARNIRHDHPIDAPIILMDYDGKFHMRSFVVKLLRYPEGKNRRSVKTSGFQDALCCPDWQILFFHPSAPIPLPPQ
jgi:hypothetical protein